MATRDPQGALEKQGTAYIMHKSQQEQFCGIMNKIADFTEHKLLKYAKSTRDLQQKMVLMAMIEDYRNGHIAVSWRRGKPTYIRVTKDA